MRPRTVRSTSSMRKMPRGVGVRRRAGGSMPASTHGAESLPCSSSRGARHSPQMKRQSNVACGDKHPVGKRSETRSHLRKLGARRPFVRACQGADRRRIGARIDERHEGSPTTRIDGPIAIRSRDRKPGCPRRFDIDQGIARDRRGGVDRKWSCQWLRPQTSAASRVKSAHPPSNACAVGCDARWGAGSARHDERVDASIARRPARGVPPMSTCRDADERRHGVTCLTRRT